MEKRKFFIPGILMDIQKRGMNTGGKVDLACLWCVKTEEIIENLQPVNVFLHHFQKFSPGQFSCNVDIQCLIGYLKEKFNRINFFHPVEEKTVICKI